MHPVFWNKRHICSGDFMAVRRQQVVHVSLVADRYEVRMGL